MDNSEQEARKVIDFLNQNDFIKYMNDFPQSYLTLLGEEGLNISGGQKQIIALARALYRKPQLLILDEPSAAMDSETEEFAINLLMKIKLKTMILLITHRLHTLKNTADNIYIMEKGKILISGKHAELMKTENLYSLYWKKIKA